MQDQQRSSVRAEVQPGAKNASSKFISTAKMFQP